MAGLTKSDVKEYSWMIVGVVGFLVVLTSLAIPMSYKLFAILFPEKHAAQAADTAVKAASDAKAAAVDAETSAAQAVESYRRVRRR